MREFERVVVTGGAGFLGSHLCERLLASGSHVVCLDNFLTGSPDNLAHLQEHPRLRIVRCDLTDFVHVPGTVDLVLHFASPASPIDYLRLPLDTLKVGSLVRCTRWAWRPRRVRGSCWPQPRRCTATRSNTRSRRRTGET
jgi:dTDP-glucose 4,6-dehydratase